MRVLVFGDSIGQGFYDDIDCGWVQMLQKEYIAKAIAGEEDVNIINLSVSGHSSQDVLSRIEPEILARKNDEKIIIILAIGVNDSYEKSGHRRTSQTQFRENIGKIINISKKYGEILVLGCSAGVDDRLNPTAWNPDLRYSNDRLKLYEEILRDCAKSADAEFVPLWHIINQAQSLHEVLPDGIHPNNKGHLIIYDQVAPKLRELI